MDVNSFDGYENLSAVDQSGLQNEAASILGAAYQNGGIEAICGILAPLGVRLNENPAHKVLAAIALLADGNPIGPGDQNPPPEEGGNSNG